MVGSGRRTSLRDRQKTGARQYEYANGALDIALKDWVASLGRLDKAGLERKNYGKCDYCIKFMAIIEEMGCHNINKTRFHES